MIRIEVEDDFAYGGYDSNKIVATIDVLDNSEKRLVAALKSAYPQTYTIRVYDIKKKEISRNGQSQ